MYLITITIAAGAAPVILGFKGADTLQKALERYENLNSMAMGGGNLRRCVFTDDFGQRLELSGSPLAFLVQNLQEVAEIDIERGLYQAVAQAKMQERARSNPTIVAAQRAAQGGPAVLSPMGANGRGF